MSAIPLSADTQFRQGSHKRSGVVLLRRSGAREGKSLLLFVKENGLLWASSPGAERSRGRISGSTEPLIWGVFELYQGPRRLYVKSVDVKEDFLSLRSSADKLKRAMRWIKLLVERLPQEHENDEVLALFWWALKQMESGIDGDISEWRFLWRWANCWGVAPPVEASGIPTAPGEVAEIQRCAMLPRADFEEWAAGKRAAGSVEAHINWIKGFLVF